jgi:alkylation response protein AidB-like acyl-CoA dehydrogenase
MRFTLGDREIELQRRAHALGTSLRSRATAGDVVRRASRVGLLDAPTDLWAATVATEALATESAAAAVGLALHWGVVAGLAPDPRFQTLTRGERVGAVALSADVLPKREDDRLTGTAAWVAPLTPDGVAIVGSEGSSGMTAVAVQLDAAGLEQQVVDVAALEGLVWGHLRCEGTTGTALGPTQPIMARVRLLLAAAGLGMGVRALQDALNAARGHIGHGAGGEQTVQGLLADAATELDAARLLAWQAAASLSLAAASMAKMAATQAAQRAVARATQVVGADSFRRGHVLERLAQDVRALELFAGRTEALREAVAEQVLIPDP